MPLSPEARVGLRLLVPLIPVAQRNRNKSALYIALRNGCEEDLEKILTENPDALFDFKFDYDEPALVRAIGMQCSRSIVRILLKHGADPNDWGGQG